VEHSTNLATAVFGCRLSICMNTAIAYLALNVLIAITTEVSIFNVSIHIYKNTQAYIIKSYNSNAKKSHVTNFIQHRRDNQLL
jgi:hypothetical protein